MDLQVFAEQHPKMYHEMAKGIHAFVERHQITKEMPLVEWDHMVDLILEGIPQEVFAEYEAEPAVEAMAHGHGPGRGHGRPFPPHHRPGHHRNRGAWRNILRLLFLESLL